VRLPVRPPASVAHRHRCAPPLNACLTLNLNLNWPHGCDGGIPVCAPGSPPHAPPVRAGRFPDGSLQPAISLLLPPLATSMSEADHLEAQRQVGAPVYFTRRPMTVAEICIRLDQISKEYYHHRDKNRGGD
jgi:hypothetical protein